MPQVMAMLQGDMGVDQVDYNSERTLICNFFGTLNNDNSITSLSTTHEHIIFLNIDFRRSTLACTG